MIKHISPIADPSNGVAVYGRQVEIIISQLPESLRKKDIVHLEIGNGGAAELWEAYRLRRRPTDQHLVLTLHDPPVVVAKPFSPYFGANPLSKVVRKLLDITIGRRIVQTTVRAADAIIVLNPLAKPVVADTFRVPKDRIHLLPLINLVGTTDSPPKPSGQHPILFFGNLARQKGLDVLIRAYLQAGLDAEKTPLTIVGGWGDNRSYRKQVDKLAATAQHIVFTGRTGDEELRQQIAAAAVIVLPYNDPGIIHASGPLVAAMTYGKAVIASDIPIFAGYIESGDTGILVPPGDVEALAVALSNLVPDPSQQAKLGAAAKRQAEHDYSLPALTKKLTEVYQSL